MSALSNVEIDRYFQGDARYGGCLAKDRLPKSGPGGKFYIINLQGQNSGDRQGTHWLAVIDCVIPDKNPDYTIFFDPYGLPPAPEISRWMKQSDKPLVWVTDQYQALDSSACGWFCLRVIEAILESTSYKQIFNGLMKEGQYGKNEKWVTRRK